MFFVMVEMIEIIGEWRGRGVFKRTARFSCDIAEKERTCYLGKQERSHQSADKVIAAVRVPMHAKMQRFMNSPFDIGSIALNPKKIPLNSMHLERFPKTCETA